MVFTESIIMCDASNVYPQLYILSLQRNMNVSGKDTIFFLSSSKGYFLLLRLSYHCATVPALCFVNNKSYIFMS